MKKLLSLFAISSITLAAAGSSVACNVSNRTNPIRKSNVVYKMLPSKVGDWAKDKSYTVDLTKAIAKVGGKTLTGLYLKTGDKVTISFIPADNKGPVTYTKQIIRLGIAWNPTTVPPSTAFKITFNKSNFAVKHSHEVALEIDITLNRIDPIKTDVVYKNTPIPPVTPTDWAINKGYTVDLTKATATVGSDTFIGLYLKTGDGVVISFKSLSADPAIGYTNNSAGYINNSIILGQVWKPIPGSTGDYFRITFNKFNFVVTHSHEAAVEIDITIKS